MEVVKSVMAQVATVPVPKAGNASLRRVVYSIKVELFAGDIVDLRGQFEVTNNLGINCMVGQYLLRTQTGPKETKAGVRVTQAMTENVIPATHHMARPFVGLDFDVPPGIYWYNFVVYSAASLAKPGAFLKVEQTYGYIAALIHRG